MLPSVYKCSLNIVHPRWNFAFHHPLVVTFLTCFALLIFFGKPRRFQCFNDFGILSNSGVSFVDVVTDLA